MKGDSCGVFLVVVLETEVYVASLESWTAEKLKATSATSRLQ